MPPFLCTPAAGTELTLNFNFGLSSRDRWKGRNKTKAQFQSVPQTWWARWFREYNWGRATLLSALVENRGHLVNCFPPQGIKQVW